MLMRELSGFDPVRAEALLRFPVRELVCCWYGQRREAAAAQLRHEQLLTQVIAPYAEKGSLKAPEIPAILKD